MTLRATFLAIDRVLLVGAFAKRLAKVKGQPCRFGTNKSYPPPLCLCSVPDILRRHKTLQQARGQPRRRELRRPGYGPIISQHW